MKLAFCQCKYSDFKMWTVFLLFTFIGANPIKAKPFLYNPKAITTFVSSASAASSSPGPDGNIAYLTKNARPEKLQNEKLDEDDDFFKELADPAQVDMPSNTNNQNEVIPGIFQKKIEKILRKIRLITSIGASFGNTNTNGGGNGDDLEDFDLDFNDVGGGNNTKPTESNGGEQSVTSNSTAVNGNMPSKVTVSPGSLAVFFMELLGSVFGLAYGAAAQLTANKPS